MAITYNVYRNGEKIKEGLAEKTYKDTGLEPNTTYEYQVSAVNDYGESALSDKVSVKTNFSPVSGVSLDKETAGLKIGETTDLKATVAPATAQQGVTWESSNEAVATVDGNGKVTAVEAGEATITATSSADNSKAAQCVVTVTGDAPEKPAGLSSADVSDTEVTLNW